MPRFPRSVILRAGEPRELLKNKAPNTSVIAEARRGGGAAEGEAGGGCRLLLWGTRDRWENPPGLGARVGIPKSEQSEIMSCARELEGLCARALPTWFALESWGWRGSGLEHSETRGIPNPGLLGFIPRALSSRSLASPLHPKSPHTLQELAASCHPLQDDAAATSGIVLFICELFFIQLSS